MSLDHLDTLASAAGYAAVPDDQELAATTIPARLRYKTPDAPAPRASVPAPIGQVVTSATASDAAAAVRTAVTTAVGSAIRSAQVLVGTGRAPA